MNREKEFELRLKECTTMEEVFNVVSQFYDLSTVRLGYASNLAVTMAVKKLVKQFNPKLRNG